MAGRTSSQSSESQPSPSASVPPTELQKYLRGVDYPASKETLVERAQEEGAPEPVRQTLEALPPQDFDSPAAVSKAVGELSR